MVSLVATAEPNSVPPRVRLDLATDVAGQTFTSIAVRRNGVLLREQPYAGGETALGYDYEAPFGVPLTYTAEVVSGGWTTDYSATWASTTGWVAAGGTTSVSGGVLSLTTTSSQATLTRTGTTAPTRRVVLSDVSQWSQIELFIGDIRLTFSLGGTLTWQYGGGAFLNLPVTSGQLTLTWDGTTATATWLNGTSTITRKLSAPNLGATTLTVLAFDDGSPRQGKAGAFTMQSSLGTSASVSDSAQLDVDSPWLTHIVSPGLSMPIRCDGSQEPGAYVVSPSAATKRSRALRSMHFPLGRSRPIVVTSGPRAEYEWDLLLELVSASVEGDLMTLVADQTPLLLRTPPGVNWEIPDGWFSIGDVDISRDTSKAIVDASVATLPLTPVDPPVLPQGSTRTYGDLLMEAATYADLADLYATYTDLLAGGGV